MAATITDILIIVLLAGSVGYGVMISRRVQKLMASLEELEPLVREFSEAVDKSESSVNALRDNLADGLATQQSAEADSAPAFSSRRQSQRRLPGVQVVRDKQDLVRRFFETSRSESRA
jgi:hypothetical protein